MPDEKKETKVEPKAPPVKHIEVSDLMPKGMLLDASTQANADPDHRYRYINVKQADNALRRKAQGYEIVPEGQGGHRLGDEMALAKTPIANYKKRVDDGGKLGKQRLEAHKSEVQQAVLSVVRELRDNHGISVDEKRLFVNE